MKIQAVSISEGCILCGACVELCPEVFKIESECGVIPGADFEFFQEWIEQAQEVCPVNVIHVYP